MPPSRLYRSLIPCQHTVAHGQNLVDDSVLLLQPYTYHGAWTGVPHEQTLKHDLHIPQEYEKHWNVEQAMLEIADLNGEAASSVSKHTVRDRGYASNAAMHSTTTPTSNTRNISFRVETKRVYVCTHTGCNKKYSRMPDLRRHYRGSHLDDRPFQCRALGCERAIHGFPRRDKRDVHEKKMHIDIRNGILL